jgi:hypothetical protein
MNLDNFEVGQVVTARFTNSGRVNQFTGRIVGKTKNYWKVESITSPYENEQPVASSTSQHLCRVSIPRTIASSRRCSNDPRTGKAFPQGGLRRDPC